MNIEIFKKANTLLNAKEYGVMGTILSSNKGEVAPGCKFLLDEKGQLLEGSLPDDVLFVLQESFQEVLLTKKPKVYEIHIPTPLQIFLDPIFPTNRLIILGGGHIALPLVQMGKLLHYEVTVIDDRPSFANAGRFSEADYVICQDFKGALQELKFDNNTYVIIVTRGHRHDQTCLEEALKKPQVAYLGMIGSRRKVATILSNLQEKGYSQENLDRVYTPIGLDIGAQTPEEIAVSIMAEIIMVNHYGFSQGLKFHCAEKPTKGGSSLGS